MTTLAFDAQKTTARIVPSRIEEYLRNHGHPEAVLVSLAPLGAGVQEGLKAHGYGRPLRATYLESGRARDVVLRTMGPDHYGHDRRADRIGNMTLSFDQFAHIPRHIGAIDLGAFAEDGTMVSIAGGEPFLVTEYVEGQLYARDLKRMAHLAVTSTADLARTEALAHYLADLHAEPATPLEHRRAIRDTVGHGEGIFGLIDGYPPGDPVATPARLRALEHLAVDWRWRLRDYEHRARRTHGDFHPFNILFRDEADFSVLDASRGGAGDPADDVTCLTINYLFFALDERERFSGALRETWDVFFRTYLAATGDDDLLEIVAPFYAWRALVLASPAWYPDVSPSVRDRILRFAERLLAGQTFTPERVDDLL